MANTDHLAGRDAHNNICLEIFQSCIETENPRNIVVGVNSILRNLLLIHHGAGDTTTEETIPGHFAYVSQWLKQPNTPASGSQSFTNIFTHESLGELSPGYLASIGSDSVRHAAFLPSNFEQVIENANAWIAGASGGQITKCISRDELSKGKLIFISSSAFRGFWCTQFIDKLETNMFNFMAETTMMTASSLSVRVSRLEDLFDATIAMFPYTNSCSFLVLMPRKYHSHATLTSLIHDICSNSQFSDILSSFDLVRSARQAMPKFSINSSLHLDDILKRVEKIQPLVSAPGMSRMFVNDGFGYEGVLHFNETSIINNELGTITKSKTRSAFHDFAFIDARNVIIDRPFVFCTLDQRYAIVDIGIFIGGGTDSD